MPFDPGKSYNSAAATEDKTDLQESDDGTPLDVPPWVRSNKKNFERNKAFAKPAPDGGNYLTKLTPEQEKQFEKWAADNHQHYFSMDDPAPGYDHRGFWLGIQEGNDHAATAVNPNDHTVHLNDYWKTPYFESFSDESQWATKDAPTWNEKDQLVDKSGGVVYDERAVDERRKKRQKSGTGWGTPESPETDLDDPVQAQPSTSAGFDPSKPYELHSPADAAVPVEASK